MIAFGLFPLIIGGRRENFSARISSRSIQAWKINEDRSH
jgi:hypothetical protein